MNVGLSKGDEKPQPSPLCNGILLCDIPTPPTGFKEKVTTSKMKLHEVIWMTMWEKPCLPQRVLNWICQSKQATSTLNTQQHLKLHFIMLAKMDDFILQIVWKSLKMSHLSFYILALSTNFFPIKSYMSGNTVWPQTSDWLLWHFLLTFVQLKLDCLVPLFDCKL